MENITDPLHFLTDFIENDKWLKKWNEFIPSMNDPYQACYNEDEECYSIPFDTEDGDVEVEKRYFYKFLQDYFVSKMREEVRIKINESLNFKNNIEEKRSEFNLIISRLEYFQSKILQKSNLKKYSPYLDIKGFIDTLKNQYAQLIVKPTLTQTAKLLNNSENYTLTLNSRQGAKTAIYHTFKQLIDKKIIANTPIEIARFLIQNVKGFENSDPKNLAIEIGRERDRDTPNGKTEPKTINKVDLEDF